MRFVYGRDSWKTLKEGQENCYLLANGLGGYSSLTMIGSTTRNDHALLMACLNEQNLRCHMVTNLGEVLETKDKSHVLSSQEFANYGNNKQGYHYLNLFYVDKFPHWQYQVDGVEIQKKIAMEHGRNSVAVKYVVSNRTDAPVRFEVTPYLQFVEKGEVLKEGQTFTTFDDSIASNGMTLRFQTNGSLETYPQEWLHDLYYRYDARDGREAIGAVAHNHKVKWSIGPGTREELYLVYHLDEIGEQIAGQDRNDNNDVSRNEATYVDDLFEKEAQRLDGLVKDAGLSGDVPCQLVMSADQFIIEKLYADSQENRIKESLRIGGKTIVAGYPFFMDWGRDTMIALSGCCIAANRFEDAKTIFRSFMEYCEKGLMPNLFPEGGNKPRYNTVDASLLFINALYEYYEASKDLAFVKEAFETARDIVKWYMQGTDFNIHMDEDGLIMAGGGYDQVTWMDVRYQDILPTPRHGKPVEINAYWYSALKIMVRFCELLNRDDLAELDYAVLAQRVKRSFLKEFWQEGKGYLKDVVSGTKADTQLRCNQIWAVSVPFSMLSQEKQVKVVDAVYGSLYTPIGLRSLAKSDPEFHPSYIGGLFHRDMAYHQGTVWGFPLGGYYLAYLKAYKHSREAIAEVKEQLMAIEPCMREGCIGQIAEIYDGEYPAESRGCFAQAWSVGEILKVYKAIDRHSEK